MSKLIQAIDRQRNIFTQGLSGKKPVIPFRADELRLEAREHLSEQAWAYIDGGAGNEKTMQSNRAAFDRVAILPRMMRPNEHIDLSSNLLGTALPIPMLLAPIGVLGLVTRDADWQVARQCAETGVPFIFSNQASSAMEDCSAVMGDSPRWMQLYWSKSDELVLSFVKRAEACGCRALVLTADTTWLGWRDRDLALGYLPFLRGMGIAQYTSDPVFLEMLRSAPAPAAGGPKPALTVATIAALLSQKRNFPGGLWSNLFSKEPLAAVRLFTSIYTNPALSWDKLRFLVSQTKLPVLVKGILRPDDALMAKECGAAGIIVSNHGGRQVDGSVATLEVLRSIRREVGKEWKVLFDSGVRSGSDIFKALALGADAVLLGRPYAYGLAIDPANGVREVIRNMANELELTARLAGCRSLAEIGEEMVRVAE